MDQTIETVSEDEILAGEKTVTLRLRSGKLVTVLVKALPWRVALAASAALAAGDVAGGTIQIVNAALAAEHRRDSFLDQVTPQSLVMLSQVALQLSNGVPENTKDQTPNPNQAKETAAPASGTSSPSSGS